MQRPAQKRDGPLTDAETGRELREGGGWGRLTALGEAQGPADTS